LSSFLDEAVTKVYNERLEIVNFMNLRESKYQIFYNTLKEFGLQHKQISEQTQTHGPQLKVYLDHKTTRFTFFSCQIEYKPKYFFYPERIEVWMTTHDFVKIQMLLVLPLKNNKIRTFAKKRLRKMLMDECAHELKFTDYKSWY